MTHKTFQGQKISLCLHFAAHTLKAASDIPRNSFRSKDSYIVIRNERCC